MICRYGFPAALFQSLSSLPRLLGVQILMDADFSISPDLDVEPADGVYGARLPGGGRPAASRACPEKPKLLGRCEMGRA